MQLLLLHPKAAAIDCHDCQRWIYDLTTGEKAVAQESKAHGIKRYAPKAKPLSQCGECPKKSPENAERLKLTKQNREIVDLFLECRSMNWVGTPQAVAEDRTLRRMFAHLEQVYAAYERQQQATIISNAVAKHG